jgi:hypothetical protein
MTQKTRNLKGFKLTPIEQKKLTELLKVGQSPIWKPSKENETLFGQVKEIRKVESKKGNKKIVSSLCKVDSLDGERAFWLSTVIMSKFKELDIKLGDKIAVQFKGKKKNYLDYRVAKL